MQFSFLNQFKTIQTDLQQAWLNIKHHEISVLEVAASVGSVALAIFLAYQLHFEYSMWAALSAYVVMRPFFNQTLARGFLRIVGTLIGAAAGVTLAVLFAPELNLFSMCVIFFIVTSLTAYYANVVSDQYNYAVLFFGLTFTLIVGYGFAYPEKDIVYIGWMRAADVMIGSLSTIFVSAILQLIVKKPTPAPAAKAMTTQHNKQYLPFALLAGLSTGLTPLLMIVGGQLVFIQAAITILAVTNQPRVASIDLPSATMKKLMYRAIGCFLGALLGMLFNFICVSLSSYALLMLLTLLGTAVGKILQDSNTESSYMGAQFAVGLLMVSVHDSLALLNDRFGVHRFFGVMLGLILLATMLALFAPRHKVET